MKLREELKKALAESKPTLIEFYASWCPHCHNMMPIMNELRKEEGTKANIIQIDVDKYPDLTEEYGVKSYPAWFVYKDGQEFWHDNGEKPLSELKDMLGRVE